MSSEPLILEGCQDQDLSEKIEGHRDLDQTKLIKRCQEQDRGSLLRSDTSTFNIFNQKYV